MALHFIKLYVFLIYTNELRGSDAPGFRQGDTEANRRDLLAHLATPIPRGNGEARRPS